MKKLLKTILNVKYIKIKNLEFDNDTMSIDIHVDITKGHKHRCPYCGKKCSTYDHRTLRRKWRALDIGSLAVYIVCDVTRVYCPTHGVHTEEVPWAYHHSSFTKEFEQLVSYLSLHLTKKETCAIMRINWRTVGAILSRTKNKLEPDSSIRFDGIKRIGIDETSYKKGHKYITVITDHDSNQVIWVGKGTGEEVLNQFFFLLTQEQKENIALVSADGAKWIKKCVKDNCPNASLCIDPYHTVSWAIESMDELRKQLWREAYQEDKGQKKHKRGRPPKDEVREEKSGPTIKKTKYALGKNPENLTDYQKSQLDMIKENYPKLYRGYMIKESLRQVFKANEEGVEKELKKWLSWACRSKLEPFVELSKKIRRHKEAIVSTVKHGLSNARIESMNNKIKVLIRKSYGFTNIQNLIDMVMIVCSNLYKQIKLPYQLRLEGITL